MEKVGEKRIEIAASSLRNMVFGLKEEIRFRGGKMLFRTMEIGGKTTNVAEVNKDKFGRGIKASLRVVAPQKFGSTWEQFRSPP